MSFITAIATATPDNRIPQPVIAEFMLRKMRFHNGEARKLKTIFRASGIEYRHSVLADYGRTENFDFYPESNESLFPSTRERLSIFRDHALPLTTNTGKQILSQRKLSPSQITHLVVVCCTGMYAPGLDIELVKTLNLNSYVHRTAINFMGCYAAFNAMKIADSFCKSDPGAKVLVVCIELCSLHFQREATEDNLLANALFADGCAAILVESESDSSLKLEFKAFHNDLAPEGGNDMAWSIGDLGFEMRLSSYVPEIIRNGISSLTRHLLNKLTEQFTDIRHFAIHPGGKKILEVIEEELGIDHNKNAAAYVVLKNYGNMSSATVLFVLKQLLGGLDSTNKGEQILSFAFGPGLTLESMVLEINNI
jgi:predicted naringenin-chalcone synthase